MQRNLILLIILTVAFTAIAAGQSVYTPDKGSPERKAVLDSLRPSIERDVKQKIVFVVDDLNVQGNWSFVGGRPQAADGGELDYRNTKYWEAVRSGAFDNNFFALLKKSAGRWRVVTYAIGCTDVCYAGWWSRHKAPKGLFPHSE